jgi:hypothetical protein
MSAIYALIKQRLTKIGPVHLAYNPSYSACFSAGTIFFSHKKSANSVFQPAYNSSRTASYFSAFSLRHISIVMSSSPTKPHSLTKS